MESRRGRKQIRQEQSWKRKARKLNKDQGKAYITYKGQEKAAKMRQATLPCSCAYQRAYSASYHVRTSVGTELQVCKKNFCDLHSIGKRG